MFNRIFLFLLTNLAVLMLAGIVMSLLGVNPAQMSGLLVMAAIFGFGGSFISLLLSSSRPSAAPVRRSSPSRARRPNAGCWRPCAVRPRLPVSACRK